MSERISLDPRILNGKPVIKGTRLTVEFVLELLASGWSYEQIQSEYPGVSEADIRACVRYADHFE